MRVGDYVQLTSDIDLGWSRVNRGMRGDIVRITPETATVHFIGADLFAEVYPHELTVLLKGE